MDKTNTPDVKQVSLESGTSVTNEYDMADEFEAVDENFGEFQAVDDSSGEFEAVGENDEFMDAGEEFSDDGTDEGQILSAESDAAWIDSRLHVPLLALFFTALAGVFVRFGATRKTRMIFLISAIAFLGFYNSACPCPIMSLQAVLLYPIGGENLHWTGMVWFLGLIPLTYLLGQTWCGWVCHLGALQEFLFKPLNLEFLKTEKAQKILRYTRYVLLGALIMQLLITKTNLFCDIDPFKVIFNLGFNIRFFEEHSQVILWSLVGLLVISSLFINRPFCRAACPIGIVLGWVSRIPGASVIGKKDDNCTGCTLCHKSCDYQAINRKDKKSILRNDDCIACGNCLDACKTDGLQFTRKGKDNPANIDLCRPKK